MSDSPVCDRLCVFVYMYMYLYKSVGFEGRTHGYVGTRIFTESEQIPTVTIYYHSQTRDVVFTMSNF